MGRVSLTFIVNTVKLLALVGNISAVPLAHGFEGKQKQDAHHFSWDSAPSSSLSCDVPAALQSSWCEMRWLTFSPTRRNLLMFLLDECVCVHICGLAINTRPKWKIYCMYVETIHWHRYTSSRKQEQHACKRCVLWKWVIYNLVCLFERTSGELQWHFSCRIWWEIIGAI